MKIEMESVVPVTCLLLIIFTVVSVIFGVTVTMRDDCVNDSYIKYGEIKYYISSYGCLDQTQYDRYLETKSW